MYFLATKQPKGMERHRGHQVYRGSQLVMLLWTVVVAASCSVGGIGGAASFKIWKLGWAYVETYTMVLNLRLQKIQALLLQTLQLV